MEKLITSLVFYSIRFNLTVKNRQTLYRSVEFLPWLPSTSRPGGQEGWPALKVCSTQSSVLPTSSSAERPGKGGVSGQNRNLGGQWAATAAPSVTNLAIWDCCWTRTLRRPSQCPLSCPSPPHRSPLALPLILQTLALSGALHLHNHIEAHCPCHQCRRL